MLCPVLAACLSSCPDTLCPQASFCHSIYCFYAVIFILVHAARGAMAAALLLPKRQPFDFYRYVQYLILVRQSCANRCDFLPSKWGFHFSSIPYPPKEITEGIYKQRKGQANSAFSGRARPALFSLSASPSQPPSPLWAAALLLQCHPPPPLGTSGSPLSQPGSPAGRPGPPGFRCRSRRAL